MCHLTLLLDELAGVWELFILQLGLQSHDVNRIKRDHANYPEFSRHCLTAGLHCWINSTDDPTFEKIAAVLRGKVVPNCTLADDVEFLAKTLKGSEIRQQSKVRSTVTIEVAQTPCHVTTSNILVCGCRKCLTVFETDKCPSPAPMTFPVMNKTSLSEERMTELAAESIALDRKFNRLVSGVVKSFDRKKIPPSDILHSVMAMNSFVPVFKGERRPIAHQLKKELEKAESISDMVYKMKDYFSFFDFDIVENVIDCCGTDYDKLELRNYKAEFDSYLARRIYELPSKLANHGELGQATVVVKLDSEYEECNAVHLKLFENKLADILHLSKGVLRLCDIVSGCFELTFQVPSFIAEAIFPLSEAQETELAANHVLRLSCGDYHWPRQDCQVGNTLLLVTLLLYVTYVLYAE